MLKDRIQLGAGGGASLWPVLLVMLASALIPTACILWFMNAAMNNERLAIREKLALAYNVRLVEAQSQIDAFWDRRAADLALGPVARSRNSRRGPSGGAAVT
jgi:hypothetical protein